MEIGKHIWSYLLEHRVARLLLGQMCGLLVLLTLFLSTGWGSNISGAFAQSHCSGGDRTYQVVSGDTLSEIAARYGMSWKSLASHNHLADANAITPRETLCIPKGTTPTKPTKGNGNPYPHGQCTWWANERYHQLHGIYVPWTSIPSDAWQWKARAKQFGWHVSSKPSKGAIVDLQPWVQGAYGLGHVAVVEKILSNGNVIASNMNWGSHPGKVTRVEFHPGSGVTFLWH